MADPLLAVGVQQVPQNAAAAHRPGLLHFSLDSVTAVSRAVPGVALERRINSGSPVTIQPRTVGLLLLMLASVVAGVVALPTKAHWRRIKTQLVAASAVAVVPLTVAVAMIVMPQAGRPPAATPHRVSALRATESRQAAVNTASASTAWTTLVAIEDSLTQQHDGLIADEQHIAALTTRLSAMTGASSAPARALEPRLLSSLNGTLTTVINQHQQLASAYEGSLQREYTFFRAATQQPAELAILRAAIAHAPRDVRTAVTYDIGLVQTQTAQEMAIAAALAIQTTAPPPPAGRVTFHAPVGGVVTQAFGPTGLALEPPITYKGVFSQHFHTGLDIAAPLDTPVGAAASGVVVLATSSRDAAGNVVGYGNYVVIKHADGYETLYGHLDQIQATVGEQVRQGQVIGLLGSTGWSTGPHVHFEIRDNGANVDPALFLAAQLRP